MRRFLAAMAVTLGKRAGTAAVVGLAVTLLLGLGLARLEFTTSQESYLNKGSEVYEDNQTYQGLFGGQAMLTLFTMEEGRDVVDLFTPGNIEAIRRMEAALRDTDGVLGVVSPLTALEFTQALVSSESGDVAQSPAGQMLLRARDRDPDPESAEIRLADAAATLERINAIPPEERDFDNPEWIRFLLYDNRGEIRKSLRTFFPDERHAQLVTRLEGNLGIEEEGEAAERVLAVTDVDLENTSEMTTGAPVLLKDINDYLKGGFLTLGGIAAVLMAVVLALLFKVRWRLLALGVVIVGLVWAFGLAGFVGIPLSVVTISGLPVLLGVGIDFGIQMHSRVEEEVVLDRELHPIQETTTRLVPPLLVATVACVVSFLTLLLNQVPMIREFGVLLALGIVVIVVASVVIPTAVLGRREFRSPTPPGDYTTDRIARTVRDLGGLPRKLTPVLALLSVAVFVVGAAVDGTLELQTDPEEWVDQDSQVIRDIATLREEVGSSSELGVYVEADDVFSDEAAAFVHEVATDHLEQYPNDLLTASSLVTTVSFLIEIPGTTELAPTGEDVRLAYEVAPEDIRLSTVNPEEGALNLIFRTAAGPLKDRAHVVRALRELPEPEGLRATPSGLAAVGVGLLENLEANRTELTYIALGVVFVFLTLVLRSPIRGLLCIVPVGIAVGGSSLVAKAAGFALSPITAVGGPLVIAVCTEFTSLMLLRFQEEVRRGIPPQEASDLAATRTGRAFACSALTTAIGVGVLATSSLPLLRDFGLIVGLNVAIALLSALVVLPPIMLWAEERGWVSGGKPGAPEVRVTPKATAAAD